MIIHQHGCGVPAGRAGATAAYDLHWQALAAKWDAALLGPWYHEDEKADNCHQWSDPRKGSEKAFLRALDDFADQSGHRELSKVPWCLWGHSGGGWWVGLMAILHPDRTAAVFFRSGAPVEERDIPEAVYSIPMMCNAGVKEQQDRFKMVWEAALDWFKRMRAKGAPAGFARDPRTSHECGDSRYLAIPFLDACMERRLPKKAGEAQLRPMSPSGVWLGTLMTDQAEPESAFRGPREESVWLPNKHIARIWAEYVRTGTVSDTTPPPVPFAVVAVRRDGSSVELTWKARADFESGIQAFLIERDGVRIAQVPDKPVGQWGRALFQAMSYHDTPDQPLPEMRFLDADAPAGLGHHYRVVTINRAGLRSKPSRAVTISQRTSQPKAAKVASGARDDAGNPTPANRD